MQLVRLAETRYFIFLQKGNIDKIVIISEHNCGELKVFCFGFFFADALHEDENLIES